MVRSESLALAFLAASVLQLSALEVTGQTFRYSKMSCEDLIPRHPDEIAAFLREEQKLNHVAQPTRAADSTATEATEETGSTTATTAGTTTTTTTTTRTTTTTTTPATPPPKVENYKGTVDIQVLTSEDAYRRLKTLRVTLQGPTYFNGFMIQARKITGNTEIVGRFMTVPSRGEFLTCPKGKQNENTVVSEAAPVRLANLTFTWMAPETNVGTIEFVASILLSEGMEYKTYKSNRLRLSLYPVSTKDCAVAKSCFRYCMADSGRECPAHKTRYMASVEYLNSNTRAKFTLGGYILNQSEYIAIGFSNDATTLSNADITTCYRTAQNQVGIEHYLLENLDYPPDLHLGVLKLDSSDVDEGHVWCSFTRSLTGKTNDLLDLSKPSYYFYFWGVRNGTQIYIPSPYNLRRSQKMLTLEEEPFNEIIYGGAPHSHSPVSIVAAVIIFFCVHFLW
ncbi:uncharacterized protein [Macrobrachium rosenbergii]|uniref:uncharacterized protein n=1 Tax=Macrobrachium rosenbergii TaxID=79674 RepID=UPI0034D7A099